MLERDWFSDPLSYKYSISPLSVNWCQNQALNVKWKISKIKPFVRLEFRVPPQQLNAVSNILFIPTWIWGTHFSSVCDVYVICYYLSSHCDYWIYIVGYLSASLYATFYLLMLTELDNSDKIKTLRLKNWNIGLLLVHVRIKKKHKKMRDRETSYWLFWNVPPHSRS